MTTQTKQQILLGMAHNASGVTPQKQDKRHRTQFRFWLDTNKADEHDMALALEAMKADKSKSFAQFMRDAIRLMLALIAGDVSVLMELFPGIVDSIKQEAIAEHEQQQASVQFEAMINQAMQRIERKLETVSVQAIVEPVATEAPAPVGLQPLGGLQTLSAPKVFSTAPLDDSDDDMELEVKQAKGDGKAAQNFLDAMLKLQGDN